MKTCERGLTDLHCSAATGQVGVTEVLAKAAADLEQNLLRVEVPRFTSLRTEGIGR